MKKIVLGLLGLVVLVLGGGGAFVALKQPAMRPASDEKVALTPERLARGTYLAESLLSCMHCHTKVNPTRWGGLGDAGDRGAGGLCWGAEQGFPGQVCSANLTPDAETGLGSWTDGEIMRAIREGVSRDGRPLFPIMDYTVYRQLPDEDVRALVAYVRNLAPKKNAIPARELKFPLSLIVKFMPKPLEAAVPPVDASNAVTYGAHLATVGGCKSCHTPTDDKHQKIAGKEFSGGQEFKFMGLVVRSANISPHESGLGVRTKENFIAQFRGFSAPELWDMKVDPTKNTVMPWLTLSRLTDQDLGAIFEYLKTVPGHANVVEKHPHPQAPAKPVAAPDAAK